MTILGIVAMVVGIVNYVLFFRYMNKNYFTVLKKFENKQSIIRLPLIINLKPEWFKYLFTIKKTEDKKIKFYKVIYILCVFIFIVSFCFTAIFPLFE